MKSKGLTIKQKKFIAHKVAGATNAKAYIDAGYSVTSRPVAEVNASRLLNKANIQQAINEALEHHNATPEFAVGRLKAIAEQSKELGASRLASKDILELHGWNRGDKPQVTLDIRNASFYNQAREYKE